MSMNDYYEETITKKLQDLSPELLEEVIDFIEFLKINFDIRNATENHNKV